MSNEVALAEFTALQDFISRQEDLRFKARSVTTALVTGLALARASQGVGLGAAEFLVLTLGVLVFGWMTEALYNAAEHTAIKRSREVEEALRGERTYDGPLLGKSLQDANTAVPMMKRVIESAVYPRILVFHTGLAVLVILVSLLAGDGQPAEPVTDAGSG